jgi:outer membrane receptor protein involved in Fe transport
MPISALNTENNKHLQPSVDLYFNKRIKESQELSINVVGTYYDASFNNKYLERTASNDTNFYSMTNINSDKYSLISDAIYSYSLKHERISAGLRNMYAHSSQDVLTTGLENLTSNQNDLYSFVELTGSRSKFSYSLSAGVNYSTFNSFELDKDYSYLYFRPIVNVRYELNKKSDLFLSYQINTRNPSLSELSNNPVMQDYYFAYSGNPNLEPFTTHSALFSYGYSVDNFNFMIDFTFDYSKNPILPYFIEQPDYILQTYDNLDNAKKYGMSFFAQWFPFKSKWLRLWLSGEVFRNENKGQNFSWSHNDYRLIPAAIVQYNKVGWYCFLSIINSGAKRAIIAVFSQRCLCGIDI